MNDIIMSYEPQSIASDPKPIKLKACTKAPPTIEYHPQLIALIKALPDTKLIRNLMKADLKRQYMCCHTSCDFNCALCQYYGEGWLPFHELIARLMPPSSKTPRDRRVTLILKTMTVYMNTHPSCSSLHKLGQAKMDPIIGCPDCERCMAYQAETAKEIKE